MKREAIGHSKMKRLCRRLDIPQWQGVGLLESIWHLTAREAPRGDIGKLSNEDIAIAIDYRGNEDTLMEALILSGWLDRDPEARLAIHDWHAHCEDSVHMKIARARQFFVGGHAPKLAKLPSKEREALAEFYECAHGGSTKRRFGPLTFTYTYTRTFTRTRASTRGGCERHTETVGHRLSPDFSPILALQVTGGKVEILRAAFDRRGSHCRVRCRAIHRNRRR